MSKTKQNSTKKLVLSAIFIAISVVLNILTPIKLFYGGSVTLFSMVPLALLGWCYGSGWGFFCGAICGILNMLIEGLSNFSYVSGIWAYLILIFADYFVAFGVMGLSGIFKNVIKNKKISFTLGAVLCCTLRFICHYISGVTIWADYTNGWIGAWIFSLTYNGSYMLPELIITAIGCFTVISIKPIINSIEK
ncbi:MAG: energy-coupled thiamine transporter ThiT [Clostridia bacterium]|nr:energy-coupled thiamine transporter ThiT [Clostridia bacterium]